MVKARLTDHNPPPATPKARPRTVQYGSSSTTSMTSGGTPVPPSAPATPEEVEEPSQLISRLPVLAPVKSTSGGDASVMAGDWLAQLAPSMASLSPPQNIAQNTKCVLQRGTLLCEQRRPMPGILQHERAGILISLNTGLLSKPPGMHCLIQHNHLRHMPGRGRPHHNLQDEASLEGLTRRSMASIVDHDRGVAHWNGKASPRAGCKQPVPKKNCVLAGDHLSIHPSLK